MCQPLCAALPQRGDNSLEFPAASSYRRSRFTARLGTTWITAGIGVIILIVSFVLMAYSAPRQTGLPARPVPSRPRTGAFIHSPGRDLFRSESSACPSTTTPRPSRNDPPRPPGAAP